MTTNTFTIGAVLNHKLGIGDKKPQRSISAIAYDIKKSWKNVYFGAVPYLDAMLSLGDINDTYGCDSAKSIVLYFLSNAASFRGDDAKRLKAELKALR